MDQLRRSLIVLAFAVHAGCGSLPPPAWTGGFASPDALAVALLDGMRAGDARALEALALTEHELRTTVWPYLPASRPEVGMDWAYFWRDHAQRSASHLRTLVSAHAGRSYELVAVSFDGGVRYGPLTVSRAPVLDVRTPEGPARLRLSGSMSEMRGQWKLYSFVVD